MSKDLQSEATVTSFVPLLKELMGKGPRRTLQSICMAIFLLDSAFTSAAEVIRPAPSCNLTDWSSGKPIELNSLSGKVVYIDFWASWCTSCVASFPFLNQLKHDFSERGLVVLGINLDEQQTDATRFLMKHPVEFTLAANPNRQCPKVFGVPGMPAAYVIDRKGNIRHEHLGFKPGQGQALRSVVEQLLNE